jgi:hypothetical protein
MNHHKNSYNRTDTGESGTWTVCFTEHSGFSTEINTENKIEEICAIQKKEPEKTTTDKNRSYLFKIGLCPLLFPKSILYLGTNRINHRQTLLFTLSPISKNPRKHRLYFGCYYYYFLLMNRSHYPDHYSDHDQEDDHCYYCYCCYYSSE